MKIIQNPSFLQAAGNAKRLTNYFYITSLVDRNELEFDSKLLGLFSSNLQYSINSTEEDDWNQLTPQTMLSLDNGDSVYFRNYTGETCSVAGDTELLTISDEFNAGGEITRVFYPNTNEMPADGLRSAFAGLPIVSAKELVLHAEILGGFCYAGLFSDCTSLTEAPALPATTLAEYCYADLFSGCTSLTEAPALPATTLAKGCYSNLFSGCTSLTEAPALPATTLAESCYSNLFSDCTSLTEAPALPATTLAKYCYSNLFYGCTSLTEAPALPATTLAEYCYIDLFHGCTSLSSISCFATDISASYCTLNWVKNVAINGTFTKAGEMEDWTTGVNGIPSGWTVVNED